MSLPPHEIFLLNREVRQAELQIQATEQLLTSINDHLSLVSGTILHHEGDLRDSIHNDLVPSPLTTVLLAAECFKRKKLIELRAEVSSSLEKQHYQTKHMTSELQKLISTYVKGIEDAE